MYSSRNRLCFECECLYILSPLFTQWQILCKLSLLSAPLCSVPLGSGSMSVIKSCFVQFLGCNDVPQCGSTMNLPASAGGWTRRESPGFFCARKLRADSGTCHFAGHAHCTWTGVPRWLTSHRNLHSHLGTCLLLTSTSCSPNLSELASLRGRKWVLAVVPLVWR